MCFKHKRREALLCPLLSHILQNAFAAMDESDDRCRAVNPLNKEVREILEGKVMTPELLIARLKGVAVQVVLRIYVGLCKS
jgi:hypothetical protein